MAALNFPPSPSTNQIYTANGKSWRFDGTSWKTYYILNVQGGGTGNTFYNLGDILVGAGTSLYPLPVGSNNFVLTADNSAAFGITWRSTAATGITTLNSLTATTQYFSIGYSGNLPSVSSSGSTHTFNIPIAGTGATGLVSTLSQSFAGIKTFTNDLIVSSSTVSTSTSTGALTITGGVGIGGSLFLSTSVPSSLSGVVVNNGVITAGSWAGNTITAYYGGTGYNSYSKGDILVGAGNTFIKLNVGTDSYVLTASSSSSTGLTWSPTAATGLTTLNGLNAGVQYLAFGYSGTVPAFSSSGSTHTLNIPLAGSGSTGLVSTQAQTIAGQKTFTSAIIGDLTGTATTAGFASTANYAYQSGYGITAGFATTASYSYQAGYGITAGFATTASYSYQSGYGITAGFATTASYSYQAGYGITAGFATTASYAYQAGYGITAGFATTASYSYQSGYGITSGFATTASYAYQAGYGLTAGFATTAANINVNNAISNLAHPIHFSPAATGSGVAVSSNTTISFNPSSYILSTSGLAVTASTASTSSSTGAFVVTGGVGIGGSLFVTSSLPSSLSGVVVNNGVITNGSWAGSLITGFYGGTGYNSYTKGDILVGAGNTFIKLNVGTDNFVLTADATSPSGVRWTSVAGLSITSVNGLTASAQFFSTGSSGAGFNISSSGSTHTFNIPIAGTGATGLVSTLAQSFAGAKTFTNDVIISSTTGSTAFNTGALTVYGGLGVSGQLSFNQAALGYTGASNPSMAFIGSTTAAPITLTVLSDNSLLFEGTSGKLFGINNNLSSGWIFNVGDISGLPIIRANADGTIAMAEFTANVGIGLSNPSYKLHVVGDTNLSSGYVYRINGTQVLSSTSLGTGVTNSSLTAVGTLTTGVWAATAITAYYGGTGYNSYTKGDILVGAGNTFIKLGVGTDNYVLTASSSSSTGLTWYPTAATGLTTLNGLNVGIQYFVTGTSGNVFNISSSGSTHTFNIPIAGTGSTGLVSTQAQSFAGIKTFTNAVSITDNTGSGSYTSGALVITGGVGIGGTLNVQGDLNVQGTFTTINSTTITVADKNIELGVVAVPTDLTAEAGGITLRGATNKSINWYSGVGWSSSESWNLASGNTYKINGTTVLSSNTLGTGVIFSSIQTAGIITSGTWSATAITALYGGTGLVPSFTVGDILYANTSSTWGRLAANSNAGYVLTSAGSGATPTYVAPSTLSVGFASTASYSYQSGYGATSGFATTASYSYQAGYGITAGLATTATYSYQSGYGITAGFATTASYAYQSGYGITAGFATTASYSYQSGYGITSGFATTANYAYQSGYGITAGFATTASYSYQSGYGITSGFATTASYSYQSGYGITSGFATTSSNINVANAASGTFFPVLSSTSSSASGIGASVNGFFSFNAATGAFGATSVNIISGQSYSIGGNSVLSATSLGTGVTNSSLTTLGTISTGVWSATAITSYYGGTGYQTYSTGDLLVGAGSTLYKLPVGTNSYVLTADNTAPGGLKWSVAASTGVTTINALTSSIQYFATGTSGSGFNISSSGSTHTFNIPIAGIASTGLVSTLAQSFAGVKTFTNDTIISSSTVSTSTSTGALTVTGGVGIGGSLFTGTSTADSISGVVLNNGVITTGSWSATAITARYGGTGNTSYTLGDLLVGAGSTFIKLPVGINSYVLSPDSAKPSGIGWTTVTPLTVSTTPPASPKNADLWFNSFDGSLLVYYSDVDTNQWVEIALGSGIDLSQPVHITNTTPSTSTSTGALIVDGGVGVQGALHTSSLVINGTYDVVGTSITLTNTGAGQVIYTLDASVYRSVKFMIQITHGTDYQVQEILLLQDGADTYLTQYAQLLSGNDLILATYDADLNSGNMRLLVSPTYTNTTFKIYGTAVRL